MLLYIVPGISNGILDFTMAGKALKQTNILSDTPALEHLMLPTITALW